MKKSMSSHITMCHKQLYYVLYIYHNVQTRRSRRDVYHYIMQYNNIRVHAGARHPR
jgi:hypothetical protein